MTRQLFSTCVNLHCVLARISVLELFLVAKVSSAQLKLHNLSLSIYKPNDITCIFFFMKACL